MANEAKIVVTAEDRARKVLEGVQNSLGQVSQKGESLNAAFARLGPLFGSAFAATTFTAFIKSTAQSIDALNDVKDITGSTIENISALQDTAVRTGGSLETVTTSLVKLNQVLGEADPGSDKAKVLQAIGLSAKELRALDPADALEKVARALATFSDDGNKARVTQELFGRSLREVAPFLNDLAEKGKKNATVTDEQAKAAEDFNKQLSALDANSQRLARTIGSEVLPQLNALFDRVNKRGVGGSILDALGFGESFDKKRELAGVASEVVKLDTYLKRLKADQAGGIGFFGKPEKVAAEIEKITTELEVAKAKFREADTEYKRFAAGVSGEDYSNEGRGKAKPSVGVLPAKTPTPKREEIDGASQALAGYVQQLQSQLTTEQELTAVEQARLFLKSLGTTGEIEQVRELVLEMAKKVTVAKQDQAITEDNIRIEKERAAELKSLTEQLEEFSGRAEEARKIKLTNLLESQIASGNFNYTKEELERIVKSIAGIKEVAGKELSEMGEFAKQAARTIQSELGENLEQVLDGHFNGILNSWGNLIKKMAAQALSAQLGKTLFGDYDKTGSVGGLFGQGLSYLGQYFGGASPSAKGNAFDPNGVITAFAAGGVFNSPTAFSFGGGQLGVMGEAGPEAVMPLHRGPDGKLGVAAAGAQQAAPTIVFNIAAGVTRNELMSLIPRIKEEILSEGQARQQRKNKLWGDD
ncbi:phage tail tape measure protein [Roseateles sp. UC29_93]|uniref:phage tail tape measure protein n=1 Tax=Roseateles sp. UC29_93 TaxID=3350177 RepID=UPI00366E2A76